MTDATMTFWDKFRANLQFVWHKAQTWSTMFWGTLTTLWQAIDNDAKTQMVHGLLQPKWVGVGLAGCGIVSFFVAHGWPQPNLTAKLAANPPPEPVKNNPMPVHIMTEPAALDSLPKVPA
jgi:hypothetical protein